jgi:hypothetical protein
MIVGSRLHVLVASSRLAQYLILVQLLLMVMIMECLAHLAETGAATNIVSLEEHFFTVSLVATFLTFYCCRDDIKGDFIFAFTP